jgi:hypothetical protein
MYASVYMRLYTVVSNGGINPEDDLAIMSQEGIQKTRCQCLPGGTTENGGP